MRTRTTTMLAAMLLALSLLAAPAAANGEHDDGWGPMGPHPHALLLHADFEPNPLYGQPMQPPYLIHGFRQCVDLAGGTALPRSNHHTGVHQGRAGDALRNNASHIVVPATCMQIAAAFSG